MVCIIEVYRTDRAHKRKIERETDESIILSKEQAKQMQEAIGPRLSYRPVAELDDEKDKPRSILKNGSLSRQHSVPEAEKLVKIPGITGKAKNFFIPQRLCTNLLTFIESQLIDHEPQWDSFMESQNSLKSHDDDDEDSANETDLLVSLTEPTSLKNAAPLSSISEVTLDKIPLE